MIRDARSSDAEAIAAIWAPILRDTAISFWPGPRSADEVAQIIDARHTAGHGFFVAEDAARLLGFASYGQFRTGAGYLRSLEHTIHLAPEARGRGVGTALMRHVESHARAAGGRLMIGAVTGSNAGSIAFHTRLGYAEWGRIPAAGWKFGEFHDLVLMGKDLAA